MFNGRILILFFAATLPPMTAANCSSDYHLRYNLTLDQGYDSFLPDYGNETEEKVEVKFTFFINQVRRISWIKEEKT